MAGRRTASCSRRWGGCFHRRHRRNEQSGRSVSVHSEIRDVDALARRFYVFCPDVVEQGTGTVKALPHELRESQRLYCWWD